MQSLSRSAYADAFSNGDPKETGGLLKARMAAAREVNDRLADFFAERGEAEDAYAKALQRALAALKQGSKSSSTKTALELHRSPALGHPSVRALERVVEHETAALVRVHEALAKRCRDELEVPLRSRGSKDDWNALSRQEKSLESTLREYDEATSRLHKAQQKSQGSLVGKKNTEKLPALEEDAARQQARWHEQAPAYLSSYQQLDFARLNSIKELMTSFETLQNDLGRERMELAERGLESILTWEVEQELTEFVSEHGFRGGNSTTTNRQATASSPLPPAVNVDSPTGEFGRHLSPTTPARPRAGTDAQSFTSNGRAASITSSTRGGGGGGGFLSAFKSGNKLDRRRSTAQNQRQNLNGADSDEERDNFRSSGSMSTGRPSRDRQQSNLSAGRGGNDSDDDFNTAAPAGRSGGGLKPGGKSKRDSFMPSFLRRKNTTAARNDSFSSERDRSDRRSERETTPRNFGNGSNAGDRSNATDTTPTQTPQPRTAPANISSFGSPAPSNNNNDRPLIFDEAEELATPAMMPDPPKKQHSSSLNPFAAAMGGGAAGAAVAGAAAASSNDFGSAATSPQVDDQGFSVPPADHDKPAWSGGAAGGSLMDEPDSDTENQAPQNMRLSILPSATKSGDSDADREAAMLRMKNTLLQTKSPSVASGSVNRRGTRAAGRSSRHSTLGPTTPSQASPSEEVPLQSIVDSRRQTSGDGGFATPGSPASSTFATSPTAPPVPQISTPLRAGSIMSGSESQFAMAGTASPSRGLDMSKGVSPGFRAALLETVNVLFRNGNIERVLVTGNLALSLTTPVDKPIKIRIANFEKFDKAAPNKTFMMPSSSNVPGEYIIDTKALHNSNVPVTTILKYSIKTSGLDARAFVPVEVNAQWKLEANQTSFFMTYHGNPECTFASAEASVFGGEDSSATEIPKLQDVAFSVPIIGSGVANVQSKPPGSYSADKHRIVWKMDDLDMTTSRAAKILARFAVEETSSAQPVSVQWRLPDRLASGTHVEIVDNADIKFDEIVRSTSSGKYQAH